MADALRGVHIMPARRDLPPVLPVCRRCGERCTDRRRDGSAVCVPCEDGREVDREAGARCVLVVRLEEVEP